MINKERLFQQLLELGKIGRQESGGITRLAFTEADLTAKSLVRAYMNEAGLTVREDAVGNLYGRKEGMDPEAPVVLTGSHIDTVYDGGIFDGALGVLGGIEALRTMNEQGIQTEHPLEVCAFKDEEGSRFNFSMMGSRGIAGILTLEDLEHVDRKGLSIADVMTAHGLQPKCLEAAARSQGSIKAHVELHVEQGKVLENNKHSAGIVTGINSSLWLKLTIQGESGHAGATPMNLRHDALTTAAQIIQIVEEEALRTRFAVGTVGKLKVLPNGINIIPGTVEFTIDLRDIDRSVGDKLESRILQQAGEICVKKGVKMEVEVLQRVAPVPCSELVVEVIKDSFTKIGLERFMLPSGAGHDSMHLARICPIGMIFVRSKDGISHNPAEWSSPEDCADGVNVLYHTLLSLAI